MYDSYMNEVAVSEARNRLADVIEETRRSGEPISVTRRGRRVAVILEAEAYDRLVDTADDVEDRRDLAAARADDDYVPTPTTCGVGECEGNAGQLDCQSGSEVDTCDPLEAAAADHEGFFQAFDRKQRRAHPPAPSR